MVYVCSSFSTDNNFCILLMVLYVCGLMQIEECIVELGWGGSRKDSYPSHKENWEYYPFLLQLFLHRGIFCLSPLGGRNFLCE